MMNAPHAARRNGIAEVNDCGEEMKTLDRESACRRKRRSRRQQMEPGA
jgi:hypothetical protein